MPTLEESVGFIADDRGADDDVARMKRKGSWDAINEHTRIEERDTERSHLDRLREVDTSPLAHIDPTVVNRLINWVNNPDLRQSKTALDELTDSPAPL